MLQIFNFVNARRILDEVNIFENFWANYLFQLCVAMIFIGQIIIVTFGSIAFGLYPNFGLVPAQWGICFGLGVLSLPWGVFIKVIKEEMCCEFG
jgi:hypothetical protein